MSIIPCNFTSTRSSKSIKQLGGGACPMRIKRNGPTLLCCWLDYSKIMKVRSSRVKEEERLFHCCLRIGKVTRACLSAKARLRIKIVLKVPAKDEKAKRPRLRVPVELEAIVIQHRLCYRFVRTFLFHFALCSFFPLPLVCCSTVYGRGTDRRNRETIVSGALAVRKIFLRV